MGRTREGFNTFRGMRDPSAQSDIGRIVAANSRSHPAELAVTLLFLALLTLAASVRHTGHPYVSESLRYSVLYAFAWLLWMAVALHVPPTWRFIQSVRDLGPWLAVMQGYNLIRYLIPAVHPVRMDEPLRRLEASWGLGSVRWTRALMGHPRWTDLFCAIYLSLFAWMTVYAVWYAFVRRRLQQRFMLGFVLIYCGGFLGYLLVPAIGPRYAWPGEWSWLSGGAWFALCNRMISGMGAGLDAWPSLHTALSLYLVGWQARHHRWSLLWGAPLTAGIWLSTMWLGFHYVPDLAAGALLGLAALALGERLVLPGSAAPDASGAGRPAPPLSLPAETRGGGPGLLERGFFRLSSGLTDRFPGPGAWFLDSVVLPIFASRALILPARRRNRRIVSRIAAWDRILVVSDMHIGDAIYTQAAVSALRDFFPRARIDYAVHHAMAPLIEGNPEISTVLPVFTGTMLPARADRRSLERLLGRDGYDFYLNFSPFFAGGRVYRTDRPLLDMNTHSHEVARNQREASRPNHLMIEMDGFVRELLATRFPTRRPFARPRISVYLRESARAEAERWLGATGWKPPVPLVFLNPDAASPYTRIPEPMLCDLLSRIGRGGAFLLIGEGITKAGSGKRLLGSLPPAIARSSRLVSAALSLEVYAALIDFCDVFISGDTGPLHLAAARKRTKIGTERFVNRTAVISIFGATPARLSGYDSTRPGFLPACQDAPSASFSSESPCRNATCMNKLLKTCVRARCFQVLDTEAIALRVGEILAGRRRNGPTGM